MTIFRLVIRYLLVCVLASGLVLLTACQEKPSSDQVVERLGLVNRPFNLDGSSDGQMAQRPIQLDIVSIGDILLHYPDMCEYDSAGNSVFSDYFQYTKDITLDADLALVNIEAPFAGGVPAGYPLFNMSDSMAPAVYDAGYDVVYTSHNHMLDQHSDAVFRTQQILQATGLRTTGSRQSVEEPNYALVDVKGIKTAVISYTYESSPGAINGIPVPEDLDPFVNSYTVSSSEDLAEMKDAIDQSRAAGAKLVIFYLHAGTEYSHAPNDEQRAIAQFLADNGVDVIFGSHVHVVQPMETITPADGSAPVPVYWGMGNYISNQVIEAGMELENEEGIMARLDITWNPMTEEIDTFVMNYLPLWTCAYRGADRPMHSTVPELGDVSTNPSVQASGHLDRALNAFAEIHSIMGESISWQRTEPPA